MIFEAEGLTAELEMHEGTGSIGGEADGWQVRVKLGEKDAGSLRRYLDLVFPEAKAEVIGERCKECDDLATATTRSNGETSYWCARCHPEAGDGIPRPQRKRATVEGVRYLLRSAYGMNSRDADEALRQHPYTIEAAAAKGLTVEQVTDDVARKVRARLQREAKTKRA